MISKHFGQYRNLRLISRTGHAEVYYSQNRLKTPVAIKVLYESISDQQRRYKFLEETKTLERLKHPGIVRLIETKFDQGICPYFVMAYAPGGTLRHKYPQGSRLPLETIRSYTNQLATALAYAHNHKVIHCDVKPENILLDKRGRLLLSDFGISRISDSTLPQATGDPFGTDIYMAPEQFKGRWGEATDQYALAIMVYEWLCGNPPFSGNRRMLMNHHLSTPVPPLQEACANWRDDISKDTLKKIEQVLLQALAKDPSERFSRIQKFAQAL